MWVNYLSLDIENCDNYWKIIIKILKIKIPCTTSWIITVEKQAIFENCVANILGLSKISR